MVVYTACDVLIPIPGPSFKRGPPKGYIHALELRLRQVESVFGAILSSRDPRAQGLIADLQADDLARDIIGRVEHGPFGPSGKTDEHASSQEAFMAAITQPFESRPRHDGRSSRQSRLARESVSGSGKKGARLVYYSPGAYSFL